MRAEDVAYGRFVVIVYNERDLDRILDIEARAERLNEGLPYQITPEIIDAQRDPLSASLL